jgi:hypothetical protein
MHYSSGPRVIPHPLPEVNFLMVALAIRHLICLVTLIINIYGLRVGISTIKKFTSGRGWGMTPQGLSYKAFNLNHIYL